MPRRFHLSLWCSGAQVCSYRGGRHAWWMCFTRQAADALRRSTELHHHHSRQTPVCALVRPESAVLCGLGESVLPLRNGDDVKCEDCNGTRLKPVIVYKGKALYSEEECLTCGGKGYIKEGEREFTLHLHVNGERMVRTMVIARSIGEALMLSGELIFGSYDAAIRDTDEVTLMVEGDDAWDGEDDVDHGQ